MNCTVSGSPWMLVADAAGAGVGAPPWYVIRMSFWFGSRLKKPPA
ncbi:MAG: hypothetical protein ACTMIC_03465 [Cellulosimicrobium funkei]